MSSCRGGLCLRSPAARRRLGEITGWLAGTGDGIPWRRWRAIPAYVRKPAGPGPFPVVVLAYGGRYGKAPTMGLGRSPKGPTADFIKTGWAVYSIDYRPAEGITLAPIEYDDTVEAVKAVRKLPFVDPKRVGYMGGSHGAQVGARVASRVDLSGAILCAPAAMDLIEDKKAIQRGERLVQILQANRRHGEAVQRFR